jgi:hypothetical protein
VPWPLSPGGCNQEESKSFTHQWRLYARCHGGMDVWELGRKLLDYTDGPLEANMYDALGRKIGTLSETEMMEELENLAVEEIIAMISVVRPVKQPPALSSTAHRNPAHSSPAHSSPAHSSPAHSSPAKQSPAKFTPPAHAQALATRCPTNTGRRKSSGLHLHREGRQHLRREGRQHLHCEGRQHLHREGGQHLHCEGR